MALTRLPSFTLLNTDSFTFANITLTSNVTANNANLGNAATANFFIGSGANLSNITGANITGQVPNALVASTVYTNAQPNITSVGTLANLSVTGNITGGNANLGNAVTANYFVGNGTYLTGLSASVANLANTVTINAQPNITSVGILASLEVAGNTVIGGNLIVNGTTTTINSTVVQIDDLAIVVANDATTGSQANGAGIIINGASANMLYINSTNSFTFSHKISADGSLLSNLTAANITGTVASATVAASANSVAVANVTGIGNLATLNKDGNASNILYGNGVFASAPVTYGNSNVATFLASFGSNAVTTTGNVSAGNILTDHLLYANGTAYVFTTNAAGSNTQLQFNDGNSFAGNAGLTFDKTNTTLTANNFIATSTANLGAPANIKITGGTSGQVLSTDGAGNLSWATASTGGGGGGSLVMNNDTFIGNGVQTNYTLSVSPSSTYYTLVSIGGVIQPKSYYSIAGNVLTFSTAPPNTAPVEITSFGGNASYVGIATTVLTNAQPNITSVGTLTSLTSSGNITAPYFIGNGSSLTGISPATAGTVTTAAQPNITSVGTLTSLGVNGTITAVAFTANTGIFTGNGSGLSAITGANITGFVPNANVANTAFSVSASNISGIVNLANYASVANSVAAANITGTVSAATTAGTVTTAAQPNITSHGTLTGLNVSGNSVFGGWTTFQQSTEVINTKTGATGVVAHDISTGATFYHTSPAANFTANFTNVATTDARAIVAALIIVQGATPFVPTAVQIDGTAQTIKWLGSTAPTGTASKTDVVSFSFVRVSATWSVFGQYSSYG